MQTLAESLLISVLISFIVAKIHGINTEGGCCKTVEVGGEIKKIKT